jgi:hypothetical protein
MHAMIDRSFSFYTVGYTTKNVNTDSKRRKTIDPLRPFRKRSQAGTGRFSSALSSQLQESIAFLPAQTEPVFLPLVINR